jgi:hypothetical protein
VDFSLRETEIALKKRMSEFARSELNQELVRRDDAAEFPIENWKKCARFGVHGLPFPHEYGGQGSDLLSTVFAMEGLGYGCRDAGLIFGINAQMWSVQMPIWEFGSDDQKRRYLPGLISGELIGAHAMSEPGSGSDAFSLSTRAERHGERYILHGSKVFVTNGPVADLFLVFATVDPSRGFMGLTAFLVDRGVAGLRIGPTVGKMGLRTAAMCELFLDGCEVPQEARLGPEGAGPRIFNSSMEWERSSILASYVGAMEHQLERCTQYARERRQFTKPIGKFQSVANRIVGMKLKLETSRLLLYKVAWLKQTCGACPMEAAMAKLYLSEAWVSSCLDAVRTFGGYGFLTEYEVERDMRDSIGGLLYSGTSDIQRNIIARHLGL